MARSGEASNWRFAANLGAVGIAISSVVFAAIYSARLPLWEAPDEPAHATAAYALAGRTIETSGPTLPSLSAPDPPLYPMLASFAVRMIGASEMPLVRPNPDFLVTHVGGRSEEAVLHGQDELPPWPSDVAALHAVRLLNSVWAFVTVLAAYGLGLRLFPSWTAALCLAATLAWLPSFLFTMSAIEPLSLATAAGTLCLYGCVRVARGSRSTLLAIVSGGAGGIAALTSTAGVCLVTPIAVALCSRACMAEPRDDRTESAALVKSDGWFLSSVALVAWVVGGGWWYLGRLTLGLPGMLLPGSDPALAATINAEASRVPPFSIGFHPLLQTFVGRFGWHTTRAADELYGAATLVLLLTGIGALAMATSRVSEKAQLARPDWSAWMVCVSAIGAGLAMVMLPATIWPGRFGVDGSRLLVVAPACLALIVAGLRACASRRLAWLTLALPPLLLAASIVSLPQLESARYRFDRLWESPPTNLMTASGHVTFAGAATLYGYRVESSTVQAGQTIDVALYWRRAATAPQRFQSFVHIATPDGLPVAQKDQEPGARWYPPELWQRRDVVEDVHRTEISDAVAPGRYVVIAGAYDLQSGGRYRATDSSWPTLADAVVLGEVTVRR